MKLDQNHMFILSSEHQQSHGAEEPDLQGHDWTSSEGGHLTYQTFLHLRGWDFLKALSEEIQDVRLYGRAAVRLAALMKKNKQIF